MEILSITDDQIDDLLSMPKCITNPGARWKELGRAKLKDYSVLSDDRAHKFAVFVRQSTKFANSFSVGLLWHNGEDSLVLMRCNGSSHVHENKLERETIRMVPHIHIATARYISIGKKSEGFAKPTSAYNSVEGALAVLLQRCNIRDPRHQNPAQPELFNV